MDYLRFVISHEGGHRRNTRTEIFPQDVWKQPGFSFMMNAIEDPRTNNLWLRRIQDLLSKWDIAYHQIWILRGKLKVKPTKKLGYTPRFIQAVLNILAVAKETQGDTSIVISNDLPEDVKGVVQTHLIVP